jgi:hypothetical protein
MGLFIETEYTNYAGDAFKIEIDVPDYSGSVNVLQGKATLKRPKVKLMDSIRGSSLDIQLESTTSTASLFDTIIDTVGDRNISVNFYKDTVLIWSGFLKTEGITETFISDYWIVNLRAIDGLGFLDSIEYLDENGNPYQDDYSELDILTRCLQLTGQSLNFRIYVFNLFYSTDDTEPSIATQRALINTSVNTNRYVKNDKDNTIFTVKDVLESILKKYGAFICQQDNKWRIARVKDFYSASDANFRTYNEYDSDGVLQSSPGDAEDVRTTLGSDINGFDPCHAQVNQRKTIEAALGAYKAVYTYGFVKSIIDNYRIYWDTSTTVDNWDIENINFFSVVAQDAIPSFPTGYFIGGFISQELDEVNAIGIYLSNVDDPALTSVNTVNQTVQGGDILKINVKSTGVQRNRRLAMYFQVELIANESSTVYYLSGRGEWGTDQSAIQIFNRQLSSALFNSDSVTTNGNFEINTANVPEPGQIRITLFRPVAKRWFFAPFLQDIIYITEVNIKGNVADAKGESFTAKRISNANAKVELEDKISVGDNASDVYIGGIEDGSNNNTITWAQILPGTINLGTERPLLEHLVRDRMEISGSTAVKFNGSILGYLPYFGWLTIDGLGGQFMTVAWSWDTANNKIEAEHIKIFSDDISSDLNVDFALEGDSVIRPAIE